MKAAQFTAKIHAGHKQAAVEVPFDPQGRWDVKPVKLWEGRRGFPVHGTLSGQKFESAIVSRSKRYWLLLEEEHLAAARAEVDDDVVITLAPKP